MNMSDNEIKRVLLEINNEHFEEEMKFPRLRDLPELERELFKKYLHGQTMPICDDTAPQSEWDWYYPWDYDRWKSGKAIWD